MINSLTKSHIRGCSETNISEYFIVYYRIGDCMQFSNCTQSYRTISADCRNVRNRVVVLWYRQGAISPFLIGYRWQMQRTAIRFGSYVVVVRMMIGHRICDMYAQMSGIIMMMKLQATT